MLAVAESARIRSLRPARPPVDLSRPIDVVLEDERDVDGGLRRSMTVFLAGSECPFTCSFCDLWRYTVETPTPAGALPRQLETALAELPASEQPVAIKLYNASNFFDPRAVPSEDLTAIAEMVAPFEAVTVECHPRLVGDSCRQFADSLDGQLEVAMGLETVHPVALPRLNKQMTLDDFAAACQLLRRHQIGIRAFVLVVPPFVPMTESSEWTERTIEFALDAGVEVISVIPVRPGNGELERLAAAGHFEVIDLSTFENVMIRALAVGRGVILADLWDVEKLPACERCRQERSAHLQSMNRTGVAGRPYDCSRCRQPDRG